jgi:hypothetical protein
MKYKIAINFSFLKEFQIYDKRNKKASLIFLLVS